MRYYFKTIFSHIVKERKYIAHSSSTPNPLSNKFSYLEAIFIGAISLEKLRKASSLKNLKKD